MRASLVIISGSLAFSLAGSCALAQDAGFMAATGGPDYIFSFQDQQMSAPYTLPDIEIQDQVGYVNIPLFVNKDSSFSFIARGKRTALNVPLTFSDRNVTTPNVFGTIEGGFAFNSKSQSGNKFGLSATFGSAGTNLLDNGYTPIVTASAFSETRARDGDSWIFSLNYSNNSTVLNGIPIPGVEYSINGGDYKVLVGLPIEFVNWRPDPFYFTALLSPFNAMTDIAFRVLGPLQIFGGASWNPKAYQNLVNDGSGDRLIFDEKELTAGLRILLGPHTNLSAGFVYGFERRFILGQSIFNLTSQPIAVGDGNGYFAKASVAF